MTSNKFLNTALCFYIPVAFVIFQIIIEYTLPTHKLDAMHNERGLHEVLQALILFLAFILGIKTFLNASGKYLRMWIGLATLCCFYVVGEELSWGQHVFNWSTPEYWVGYNDQQETNLHNTSSLFDQKPRIMLEFGALFGGLIIPLLLKYKPQILPKKFEIIYPTSCFMITAIILIGIKLIDKADDFTGNIMTRSSEFQEVYLFYFVLLYMMLMHKRTKQA
jgi:hypothetical protein